MPRVGDYMKRKVITVSEDQTVEDIERQMLKYNKDGFPIVNNKDEIVGMIGVRDLLFKHPKMKVNKIMSRKIIAFPADMKVRFMCDASGNSDDVYIDEIKVSAK